MVLFLFVSLSSYAGDSTKLYNPSANVSKDVEQALARAKKEKKNVLLQVGGNWCVWCYRLNSFIQTDSLLKRLLNDNYVLYHLNYSKENKNLDYLKKLGYPQRFGFPVFLILDGDGDLIHTQNSWYLEDGKTSYDKEKIKAFFTDWATKVFDPKQYNEH